VVRDQYFEKSWTWLDFGFKLLTWTGFWLQEISRPDPDPDRSLIVLHWVFQIKFSGVLLLFSQEVMFTDLSRVEGVLNLNSFFITNNLIYISNFSDAVVKNFIEGVYVTPGAESPLVWFGLLVVRTGIFYGGLFRFTITIPEEFPDTNEIPVSFLHFVLPEQISFL